MQNTENKFNEGETWQNVVSHLLGEHLYLKAQIEAQRLTVMALLVKINEMGGGKPIALDEMNKLYLSTVERNYQNFVASHPLLSGFWKDYLSKKLNIEGIVFPKM